MMRLGISATVGMAIFMSASLLHLTGYASAQSAADDPVFVGAGDTARCESQGDEATANLLDDLPGTVFTVGDNAYNSGTSAEFAACYEPSWGRHKARTYPSPGNHEYYTENASGYFGYFGARAGDPAKGYYSYDLGDWHVISLNSQCGKVGGCGSNSPMVTWLEQDLATNPATCTAAYFHHPLFSSGSVHGNDPKMKPSWDALFEAGADVIVSGHSHNYERFGPQTPDGMADPERGIREFVVGTGGGAFHGFGAIHPNSEVRESGTHGVLKMTLHPDSYDWQFVPVAGKTFTDSGSAGCSAMPTPPADTTPPAVQPPQQALPLGATLGTTAIPTKVSWSAIDGEGSVVGYEVQRSVNGGTFAKVSLSSPTSTSQTFQLEPGNSYQFRARATDSANNTSDWANGTTFLVDAQQENSDAILSAGTWTQQTLSSAYGGGLRYAKAKGSAVQFTFTGSNVAWTTTKGPDRGRATVSVDGGAVVRTIDLYSSAAQYRRVIFSQPNLDPAVSHTLEVQVLGTKRSDSTDTRVDVDAFVVLR